MSLHHQDSSEHHQFRQSEHRQRVCSATETPLVLDSKWFGVLGPWAEFPAGYDYARWISSGGTVLDYVGEDASNPTFITTRYLTRKFTYNYPNGSWVDTDLFDPDNAGYGFTSTRDVGFDYGDIGDFVSQSLDSETSMTETYEFGTIIHTFENPITISDVALKTYEKLWDLIAGSPKLTIDLMLRPTLYGAAESFRFIWNSGYNPSANRLSSILVAPTSTSYPWDGSYFLVTGGAIDFTTDATLCQYGWPARPANVNEMFSVVGDYYAPIKHFSQTYHMQNLLTSCSAHKYPGGIVCDTGSIDDVQQVDVDNATGEAIDVICTGAYEVPGIVQFYPDPDNMFRLKHTGVLTPNAGDCCP